MGDQAVHIQAKTDMRSASGDRDSDDRSVREWRNGTPTGGQSRSRGHGLCVLTSTFRVSSVVEQEGRRFEQHVPYFRAWDGEDNCHLKGAESAYLGHCVNFALDDHNRLTRSQHVAAHVCVAKASEPAR